jgi:hypothetical protein
MSHGWAAPALEARIAGHVHAWEGARRLEQPRRAEILPVATNECFRRICGNEAVTSANAPTAPWRPVSERRVVLRVPAIAIGSMGNWCRKNHF